MTIRSHRVLFAAVGLTISLIGCTHTGIVTSALAAQTAQTPRPDQHPPDPGVPLTGFPGILAAYMTMERGYATKNPALVAAVWSPQYKHIEVEGGKKTTTAYARAVVELKHEFPGNRTDAGYYSPTQYFLAQSVRPSADRTRVIVSGITYGITPNTPLGDPHCKEGNSCGSRSFTHVWSRPKSGGAWRLLTDSRGAYSEAADAAIDSFVGQAVQYHQRAGLVGRARPEESGQGGGNAAQKSAANEAACQAAFKGELEALQRLVDGDADPTQKDKTGRCPLHYAAMGGRVETARWLIDNGADINAPDSKGHTPMQLAREDTPNAALSERRAAVIRLLQEEGATE